MNNNSFLVVIGAGSIGQTIAQRVCAGKPVLLADLRKENADGVGAVGALLMGKRMPLLPAAIF